LDRGEKERHLRVKKNGTGISRRKDSSLNSETAVEIKIGSGNTTGGWEKRRRRRKAISRMESRFKGGAL